MSRTETISLVDKHIVEQLDTDISYHVSVNTTGTTPDRTELKEYLLMNKNLDVDMMHKEVPTDIGTVTYEDDKIISVTLRDGILESYGY